MLSYHLLSYHLLSGVAHPNGESWQPGFEDGHSPEIRSVQDIWLSNSLRGHILRRPEGQIDRIVPRAGPRLGDGNQHKKPVHNMCFFQLICLFEITCGLSPLTALKERYVDLRHGSNKNSFEYVFVQSHTVQNDMPYHITMEYLGMKPPLF